MKRLVATALFILFVLNTTSAQSTGFTYQGRLTDGGTPASGVYDLQFGLWDSQSGGNQIGSTQNLNSVQVTGGVFTVTLDFGANAFPGANRFLEISARVSGAGSFTLLTPRQTITSTPYAVRSLRATAADSVPVSGVPAGSGNYIQNTTAAQTASLNITGGATIGGNVGIGAAPSNSEKLKVQAGSSANAVRSESSSGIGLLGISISNSGVSGESTSGRGVDGFSTGDAGVLGISGSATAAGVEGSGNTGVAGFSNDGTGVFANGGRMGVRAVGTSLFSGNTTPLPSDELPGVAIGFGFEPPLIAGYVFAYDYRFNTPQTLVLNHPGGNVGIGTTNPLRTFHVAGRARIGSIPTEPSGASVCFNVNGDLLNCGASSLRLKTNVQPFSSGLDIIRRLRPISFDWKDGSGHDIGLGAEDVALVAPSFTFTDEKGEPAGVKYERLNMLLINAIKEQQEQIRYQQQQIEALRKLVCRSNNRGACRGAAR
jgi:hypothetical protein